MSIGWCLNDPPHCHNGSQSRIFTVSTSNLDIICQIEVSRLRIGSSLYQKGLLQRGEVGRSGKKNNLRSEIYGKKNEGRVNNLRRNLRGGGLSKGVLI